MKKIIKLFKFLFYYNLIPIKIFLKIHFKRKQGYSLNFKNPITLNEKIQWLKVFDRKPLNKVVADKYLVRNFVSKVLANELLIPLFSKFDTLENITASDLPKSAFVIKSSNGCGQVLIVRDPNKIDLNELKKTLKKWTSPFHRIYPYGKEWQYKGSKPLILFEKMLLEEGKIPSDYKFHCINGKVEFIYVSIDREGINKRNIYDSNWMPLKFTWGNDLQKITRGPEINKPVFLNEMIEISEKIAAYFKYVRVDLYNVSGKTYVGEITLHHASGFDRIVPIDWDIYFGNLLDLTIDPKLEWS